jgi:hypothetical protein
MVRGTELVKLVKLDTIPTIASSTATATGNINKVPQQLEQGYRYIRIWIYKTVAFLHYSCNIKGAVRHGGGEIKVK